MHVSLFMSTICVKQYEIVAHIIRLNVWGCTDQSDGCLSLLLITSDAGRRAGGRLVVNSDYEKRQYCTHAGNCEGVIPFNTPHPHTNG